MRIRQFRTDARFETQEDLATALTAKGAPVTRTTVGFWESGKHLPDIETLYVLAKVCHKSPADYLP
jgi:DNA-binding XRE family transcriptional regulator